MRPSLSLPLFVLLLPLLSLANPIPAPDPVTEIERTEAAALLVERGAPLNSFLGLLLKHMPALDATISSLTGVLTLFENFLVLITGEKIVYNDLGGGGGCKAYTLLFARGTTEPGNVGILVGPPLIMALSTVVGASNLAVQGVNSYAASIDGYLAGGDAKGSATMADQIRGLYAKCPGTGLVVGGYSQGAQVVHNALGLLDGKVAGWVGRAVVFGDPYNGTAIPGVAKEKILTFCHVGDDICRFGDLIVPAHLSYGVEAVKAAAFVVG